MPQESLLPSSGQTQQNYGLQPIKLSTIEALSKNNTLWGDYKGSGLGQHLNYI